jgi:hypothetical protein
MFTLAMHTSCTSSEEHKVPGVSTTHDDTRPGPQARSDATSGGHVPHYPSELRPKAVQGSDRPLTLAEAAHTSTHAKSISTHKDHEGDAKISEGAPPEAMIPEPDASKAVPMQEPASIRPSDPSAQLLKQAPPPKLIMSDKRPEVDNHTLLAAVTHFSTDPGLMKDLLEDLLAIQMHTMIPPLALQLLWLTIYTQKDPKNTVFEGILTFVAHHN